MGIIKTAVLSSIGAFFLFCSAPASTSYTLQSYGVGSGGTSNSSSTTYKASTTSGEQGAVGETSTTYTGSSGINPTQLANVPSAPAITNPANYYNKLHIVINDGGNPSDATFAIAISPDGFSPTTNYIHFDDTVGATLNTSDWQTYTAWGGSSGFDVIGLLPNTTYTIKVKAEHGDFTESAYSATASASTVGATLSFDIDVSAIDTSTSPPYNVSFAALTPNSVIDSSQKVWVSLDTNAASGGTVFIASQNAGLKSLAANNTIASATADLAVVNTGYGAQNSTATQSSGGPLTAQSPYTVSSGNVGILDTTLRPLYLSSAPITAGRGSIVLKARATSDTPAANDYSDILTLIASASF